MLVDTTLINISIRCIKGSILFQEGWTQSKGSADAQKVLCRLRLVPSMFESRIRYHARNAARQIYQNTVTLFVYIAMRYDLRDVRTSLRATGMADGEPSKDNRQ